MRPARARRPPAGRCWRPPAPWLCCSWGEGRWPPHAGALMVLRCVSSCCCCCYPGWWHQTANIWAGTFGRGPEGELPAAAPWAGARCVPCHAALFCCCCCCCCCCRPLQGAWLWGGQGWRRAGSLAAGGSCTAPGCGDICGRVVFALNGCMCVWGCVSDGHNTTLNCPRPATLWVHTA